LGIKGENGFFSFDINIVSTNKILFLLISILFLLISILFLGGTKSE